MEIGEKLSKGMADFVLRLPSPVLVVFKAAEQEGILSAVEESGIDVLGQTNAETSNIVEVIEMLKRERGQEESEGDHRDVGATASLEFLETDESMYEGKTGSTIERAALYRLVYICEF